VNKQLKKKLLILSSTYPRWINDNEPGFVHQLAKRLTSHFEVHVLCPHAPKAMLEEVMDGVVIHRYKYAPEKFETLVNDGGMLANIKRDKWKLFLLPSFFLMQLIAINKLIHKIDVIHAHWIIPQGFNLYLLVLIKPNLPPYLLTSHDADLYSLKGNFFNFLKNKILASACSITVVSNTMKKEVIKLAIPEHKINIQPMGVDLQNLFVVNNLVKRNKNEILFVGRFVEKKGLLDLLNSLPLVLKKFPNIILTLVGFGPQENAAREIAKKLNISQHVNFTGPKNQTQLIEYYQRAALFVAPFKETKSGDQEGLGLVLVEALGCGCPTLVSDIPACEDVINGLTGVSTFNSGNTEDLKNKILAILSNQSKFQESKVNISIKKLKYNFDWEVVADKYADLLTDVYYS